MSRRKRLQPGSRRPSISLTSQNKLHILHMLVGHLYWITPSSLEDPTITTTTAAVILAQQSACNALQMGRCFFSPHFYSLSLTRICTWFDPVVKSGRGICNATALGTACLTSVVKFQRSRIRLSKCRSRTIFGIYDPNCLC